MVRDGPPLSPDDRGRGRLQPVSTEARGALHDEIEWEQCGDLRGQLASPVGHTAPRVRQSDAARASGRPPIAVRLSVMAGGCARAASDRGRKARRTMQERRLAAAAHFLQRAAVKASARLTSR